MSQADALREAVKLSPDNVPLLLLLGQACLAELSVDEARQIFERAALLAPQHKEIRLGLAKALHLSGKISEAVVRAESLIQEFPNDPELRFFLCRLMLAEGQRDQAQKLYQKGRDLGGLSDPMLEKDLEPATPDRPVPVGSNGDPLDQFGEEGPTRAEELFGRIEKSSTTFAHVGGMNSVKEEIRMKIIYPLKNPDLFKAYGKKPGGGVLLYGPPGCGKTLISRATAGEIDANFLSIGLHEILDMYLGNSEKNLHSLFQLARDHAPTVLFFDEVDALAADRNDFKKSAGRTLINQFLAEMDGTNSNNDGLLILGATNAPWHIDPAFRRPGRFDRILFVPPPDEAARESIIEILAQGKPTAGLDAKALAKKTRDFSGADLKGVFDISIERCLARAMTDGKVVPLTSKELLQAASALKPSASAWFESARNYALYANQGGFYDDVLQYLGIKK